MNPVFFQYNKENNVLDRLIQEFEKRSWQFSKMPEGYFHTYYWPDVVLSDKAGQLELPPELNSERVKKEYPYTIELLGCYRFNHDNNKEVNVVLFMPEILKTAKAFLDQNGKAQDKLNVYVEKLTELILIHEFTHWIFHLRPFLLATGNMAGLYPIEYNSIDSIEYHETLAQVFTNFFCHQDDELKEIFIWLEEKQPDHYKKYRGLISNEVANPVEIKEDHVIKLIFCVRLSLEQGYDTQGYIILERYFKEINEKYNIEFDKNPDLYLEKYRSQGPAQRYNA
jgi:hypothetical protein